MTITQTIAKLIARFYPDNDIIDFLRDNADCFAMYGGVGRHSIDIDFSENAKYTIISGLEKIRPHYVRQVNKSSGFAKEGAVLQLRRIDCILRSFKGE